MLTIKIAGPGCRNCHELEKRVKAALESMQREAVILKLTDFKDIAAAGVMTTPGLIVNDAVISQGKVPDEATLMQWLQEVEAGE
ncbi:MAG: thioredoxin family protein [Acidobacteriota bacterium]|jgi:small redox-active disulfide protein 2